MSTIDPQVTVLPTTIFDTIHVEGGTPLIGSIRVRGAKNLVTKAMVAALLADQSSSVLRNVPQISDVDVVRDPTHDPWGKNMV